MGYAKRQPNDSTARGHRGAPGEDDARGAEGRVVDAGEGAERVLRAAAWPRVGPTAM